VPVLYTLNAKGVYDVTARDRVWLVNVSGIDEIRLGAPEGGTTGEDSEGNEELFNFDIRYNGWRTATGFNWQRLFARAGLRPTHRKPVSQVKDLRVACLPAHPSTRHATPDSFRTAYEGETLKYDSTSRHRPQECSWGSTRPSASD
jgi:hypothetical protein